MHTPEHLPPAVDTALPIPVADAPAVVEDDPAKPWKALVALLAPGLVALGVALMPFGDAGTTITDNEWATVFAAAGITGTGVFVAKNPKRVKR